MFKVGNMVQIRYHKEEEKEKYPFLWHPLRNAMEGKIYQISEVIPNGYLIKSDHICWAFCHEFCEDSLVPVYDQF